MHIWLQNNHNHHHHHHHHHHCEEQQQQQLQRGSPSFAQDLSLLLFILWIHVHIFATPRVSASEWNGEKISIIMLLLFLPLSASQFLCKQAITAAVLSAFHYIQFFCISLCFMLYFASFAMGGYERCHLLWFLLLLLLLLIHSV